MTLQKVGLQDAEKFHAMMVAAFQELLEKYQDYETNPAAEPVEKVLERLQQENSHFYFILVGEATVGAMRI